MATVLDENLAARLQTITDAANTGGEAVKLGQVSLHDLLSQRGNPATLPYLTPEELSTGNFSTPAGASALQYSVAALLAEEVSGQYYLTLPPGKKAGNLSSDDLKMLHQTHPAVPRRPLNQLDPKLATVLARAMHPNPQRRYASMQEMTSEIWSALPDLAPAPREKELQQQAQTLQARFNTALLNFGAAADTLPAGLKPAQVQQELNVKAAPIESLLKETETLRAELATLQTQTPLTKAKERLQGQAETLRQLAVQAQNKLEETRTVVVARKAAVVPVAQIDPPTVVVSTRAVAAETERKKTPVAMLAGIAIAALVVIGAIIGFVVSQGGTKPTPTALAAVSPTVAATTAVVVVPVVQTTVANGTTSVPETTVLPTTALATTAPVITPSPAPSPTPEATATATPPPTATPVPPSPTPGASLAILSVGTTRRGDTDVPKPEDVTGDFRPTEDVYGFMQYGDARPNVDFADIILVINGKPEPAKTYIITKKEGFLFFPLGKLGDGTYKIQVQYNGYINANQPEFKVSTPVVQTQPPVVQTQPPVVQTQPPIVRTNPPPVQTQPPPVQTQPPPVYTQPPPVRTNPPPPKTTPPCLPGTC